MRFATWCRARRRRTQKALLARRRPRISNSVSRRISNRRRGSVASLRVGEAHQMNVAPRVAGRSAHGRLWHYRSATMVDAIGTACRTPAISAAAVPIVPVIHRTTASTLCVPAAPSFATSAFLSRGAGTLGPASSGGCACALHIKWV